MGEKIRRRIHITGWDELTSSLNALECLAACYDGNREKITEWLENLAPDENKGIYMMDMYAWLVKIRCYVQMGKNMAAYVLVQQLIILLRQGRRYRDLCECHILLAIIYEKENEKERMLEALSKALELGRRYQYIRLFADEGECMARMLRTYQKETGTVKFHSSNIFKKLRVQNRMSAVDRGHEIGPLQEGKSKTEEIAAYGTALETGTTGDCTYTVYDYDEDGNGDRLVISGSGKVGTYSAQDSCAPWMAKYRTTLKEIIIEYGVTNIGGCIITIVRIFPAGWKRIRSMRLWRRGISGFGLGIPNFLLQTIRLPMEN